MLQRNIREVTPEDLRRAEKGQRKDLQGTTITGLVDILAKIQ